MNVDERMRIAIGDLFVQLQVAVSTVDELRSKIAALEQELDSAKNANQVWRREVEKDAG